MRLWVLVSAATLVELGAAVGLVHAVLSYPMEQRGMHWRLADTLLVSPLLFLGVAVFAASVNTAVAAAALRLAGGASEPRAVPALVAGGLLLGALWAAFGVRAVGKLY